MTPRDRLRQLMRGTGRARPAFVPLLGTYLAPLQGLSHRDVSADPRRLFGVLRDSQQLLGLDAHVVTPDPSILAEAAGARVEWPADADLPVVASHPWADGAPALAAKEVPTRHRAAVALEVLRRLKIADPTVALAVAFAGPVELAAQLCGPGFAAAGTDTDAEDALDLASQVCLAFLKAACEIGCDAAVVLDSALGPLAGRDAALADQAWQPIGNLASYYDCGVVLVGGGEAQSRSTLESLARLPAWVIVTGDGETLAGMRPNRATSIGLLNEQLTGSAEDLQRWLESHVGTGVALISTAEPVSSRVPVSALLTVKDWLQAQVDGA